MSDTREHTGPAPLAEVDLVIGGMTCASCAARIEKRLNRLDGVTATVNYATEQAKVQAPDAVTVDELVAQVEAAGYTARPAGPAPPHDTTTRRHRDAEVDETRSLRNRVIISACCRSR